MFAIDSFFDSSVCPFLAAGSVLSARLIRTSRRLLDISMTTRMAPSGSNTIGNRPAIAKVLSRRFPVTAPASRHCRQGMTGKARCSNDLHLAPKT